MFHIHEQEDSIVKMSVLPNLIYRFSTIPVKISDSYHVDTDKLILKMYMEKKKDTE